MLTELCEELKNWFDRDLPKRIATFTIEGGRVLDIEDIVSDGQYYRIVGGANDGVHQYSKDADPDLTDETFDGAVWTMSVPKRVVKLSEEIAAWQEQYGGVNSEAMSPYQSYSESFGEYSISHSKGSSSGSGSSTTPGSWQEAFESRLKRWRKF